MFTFGGGFGQPAQPGQAAPNPFGAQPAAQPFGAQPAAQPFGAQPFGAASQAAPNPFGTQPAQQPAAQPVANPFGVQPAQQQPFGAAANIFAQPAAAQPIKPLAISTPFAQPGATTSPFGQVASPFGQTPGFGASAAQQQPATPQDSIQAKLGSIVSAYKQPTESENARFFCFVYKPVDKIPNAPPGSNLSKQGRDTVFNELKARDPSYKVIAEISKAHKMDYWADAEEGNPDSNVMIPVPASDANGRAVIVDHLDYQSHTLIQQAKEASELKDKLKELSSQVESEVKRAVETVKREHTRIMHKLISVMGLVEYRRLHNQPLSRDESETMDTLEKLQRELHLPDRYRGRLNELRLALNDYMFRRGQLSSSSQGPVFAASSSQPAVSASSSSAVSARQGKDEAQLQLLFKFLEQQNEGIKKIKDMLQTDLQAMNIINEGLNGSRSAGYGAPAGPAGPNGSQPGGSAPGAAMYGTPQRAPSRRVGFY